MTFVDEKFINSFFFTYFDFMFLEQIEEFPIIFIVCFVYFIYLSVFRYPKKGFNYKTIGFIHESKVF